MHIEENPSQPFLAEIQFGFVQQRATVLSKAWLFLKMLVTVYTWCSSQFIHDARHSLYMMLVTVYAAKFYNMGFYIVVSVLPSNFDNDLFEQKSQYRS